MRMPLSSHPIHGGQLEVYAKHYGIAKSDWLDLSTGINPNGYAQPNLPDAVFRDLPSEDDGLQQVASDYYGSDDVLMVPGSSWAIQCVPAVLHTYVTPIKKVLLPALGYSEHARAWQALGVDIVFYHNLPTTVQLQDCNVCVLINPNNPCAHLFSREKVLEIAQQLHKKSAWLIVDEAFIDTQPQNSVVKNRCDNVIVFRSLGKFFGLAGLRVGAIMANNEVLQRCKKRLPPWALNHPARFITKQALQDTLWIKQTRSRLIEQSKKLLNMCKQTLLVNVDTPVNINNTNFFVTLMFDTQQESLNVHHCLCEQSIYTRLLDNKIGIRIGLPNNTNENWQRLEHAFMQVAQQLKKETPDVHAL